MRTEAQKRADINNKKKNAILFSFRMYKNTDADLIEYLKNCGNVQGTIKQALREYMEAHK